MKISLSICCMKIRLCLLKLKLCVRSIIKKTKRISFYFDHSTENSTAVVTGKITEVPKMAPFRALPPLPPTEFPLMQERDFYKELRLRGYHYSGAFRSVIEARGDGLYGKVRWDLNWISFMDCLLQINILSKDSRSLLLPTRYKMPN